MAVEDVELPPNAFARTEKLSSSLPSQSVVKFFVTKAARSYLMPWVVHRETNVTGTGFVIDGRLLMTNAHVIEDAMVVEVKKHDLPKKFRGRVVCIGHDVDLALVRVDDERFWCHPNVLLPVTFSADTFAELYSEVRAVGFPTGGSTICVSKGVVPRVDAQIYVHSRSKGVAHDTLNSPGRLPIIQIDAAINPGNSGGPTFDITNNVIGVASSGLPKAQNVGYIIPTKIAMVFLKEYLSQGSWSGICETGLETIPLENDAMREFLRMGQRTGVRVVSVAPLGAAQGKIHSGDILVEVDGLAVSNEHTVPLQLGEQKVDLDYGVLISQKQKGEITLIKVLRNGEEIEQQIVFAPIPPLARRFDRYDSSPRYLLVGGLVFSVMSLPLFNEFCELRREDRRLNVTTTTYFAAVKRWKDRPEQEVIILLRTLKHPVNLGYNFCSTRILSRFNGKSMESLAQLAEEVSKALDADGSTEEFLRFGFEDDPEEFDSMVLKAEGIRKADLELCKNHRISQPAVLEES
mmetsp:Transcript_78575/g.173413  ORF Transcript_78575/g.173413 Transcript_78575/m.173413 type:complete len:519 (-) Transcript_78575:146-1702(-)